MAKVRRSGRAAIHCLRLGRGLCVGFGVPAHGGQVAFGALIETARAIAGTIGELFFHIALDRRAAERSEPVRAGKCIGAIGSDIAGMDHAFGCDAHRFSFCSQGGEGFEIAVHAAEDEHRVGEYAKVLNAWMGHSS